MNTKVSHLIRYTLAIALGSLTYLGGCGPQDLNDIDYLAQTKEDTVKGAYLKNPNAAPAEQEAAEDEDEKTDDDQAPAQQPEAQEAQEPEGQENQDAEGPEAMKAMPGAQAMPAGVAIRRTMPVAVSVPTRVIQAPTSYVRLPSEVRQTPPVIINTSEDRNYARRVHFLKKIHVMKPEITRHLIKNNHHLTRVFQTQIVNHPIHRTQISQVSLSTQSDEVLPTTEITLPTVVSSVPTIGYAGCAVAACGVGYGYGYGYGRGYLGYGYGYGRGLYGRGYHSRRFWR